MPAHPAGPRHEDQRPGFVLGEPPTDVNALDAAVWPTGTTRANGVLEVSGLPVTEAVTEFGSPLYLIDEEHFRASARSYVQAFGGADVYYAAKAFLSGRIAQWADQEGLRIDVCTLGELEVALRAGVPGDRLLFHGNNKSKQELRRALEVGVGRIVVDSLDEIDRLADLAADRAVRPKVLIRVTVGVEAHTHEFIATAHEDQKFGLALAGGLAATAAKQVAADPRLDFVGLHSHIGSQIFDAAGFEVAAHRMAGLVAELVTSGVAVAELNLGGGMGIAYTAEDDPLQVADMADQLRGIVARECEVAGVPVPRLAVEPGRAIVGNAGITVYEVGTVKPVDLGGRSRLYVSVDGGMSDNIRVALYGADYTVTLANRSSSAEPVLSRVVGKHCESGDVVVRDAWLPGDIRAGDLLAVAATGAYCRSMASNYNYLPRPAVVAVRAGSCSVVLRRENLEDLFQADPGLQSSRV
ncbi:MAG TPA: diaminopimelate decarboxylase [Actinomycetota bacterium]|nr:diaminopimelate decarboxylase [Actinomycetota bacterium]